MGYSIAVVGATGAVGREMLNVLADRKFPADEVFAVASRRSKGREVSFGETKLKCHDLETFDFTKCDIASDERRRQRVQGVVAEDRCDRVPGHR